jgi:MGT family glycosyltransferase
MRVLLAAHPTVGHTNALRTIGRSLAKRGHHVAFATTVIRPPPRWLPAPEVVRTAARIPAALERDGFELVRLRSSLASLGHAVMTPLSRGYAEMRHALRMFCHDAVPHARAIAAAIDRTGAEVVLADYLQFGAYLAAKLRGRPFAAFYHSALPFPGPERPPFGSGLPFDAPRSTWVESERALRAIGEDAVRRIHRACREAGIPPPRRHVLSEPYSDDGNLLATVPELEPGLPALGGPVHFVGPCLEGRDEPTDHPALEAIADARLRVYVSMGTVFDGKPSVFGAVLRGLDRPGVRVVVSAGASLEALRRRPPTTNARFFARVPQLAVLRAVDVVVGHGGNNSTLETIAAGKPLVVVPFGADQLENARRVEALGCGVAVMPDALSAAAVSRALDLALARRERARSLARVLDGVDGTARSVALVEALGRDRGGGRAGAS